MHDNTHTEESLAKVSSCSLQILKGGGRKGWSFGEPPNMVRQSAPKADFVKLRGITRAEQ